MNRNLFSDLTEQRTATANATVAINDHEYTTRKYSFVFNHNHLLSLGLKFIPRVPHNTTVVPICCRFLEVFELERVDTRTKDGNNSER